MSAPTAPESDAFGSFTTAERLSDPYADVYGLPLDQSAALATATASSPSLLAFSPDGSRGPAPTLAVSPSSLADPFADILAASSSAPSSAPASSGASNTATLLSFSPLTHGDASTMDAAVATGAAPASGLLLPPPRSSATSATTASVVDDLLSFSPLAADSAAAPFADVFDSAASSNPLGDDPFPATGALDARALGGRAPNSFSAAAPVSTFGLSSMLDAQLRVPASAPASLHGSSQHDATSFAASAAAPDDEDDDWTDFVAADGAAKENGPVDSGRRGQEHSASHWEAARGVNDPFESLDSNNSRTASLPPEEPALGAFELPSPQSLGIEGASSASAELNPEMYFFSQGSGETTGVDDHGAGQEGGDPLGVDSEPETASGDAASIVAAAVNAFSISDVVVESNGASKEETNLWGPLSPPSSSHVSANVDENSPSNSSSASHDAVDVSALDPFSFTGVLALNAGAPISNGSSGDYYDLLAGTSSDSGAPIEFAPIQLAAASTGEEDAFGDFSAGSNTAAPSDADDDDDEFGEHTPAPPISLTTADNDMDVMIQEPATTAIDTSMAQSSRTTGVNEASTSELESVFPDSSPSDTVDSGGFEVDDAFGDFAEASGSPEHGDGSPVGIDTSGSFAQSSIALEEAHDADVHVPGDEFGDFASMSGGSTPKRVQEVGGHEELESVHPSSASTGRISPAEDADDAFGSFAQSSGFSSTAGANADDEDDFGDFEHSATFVSSAASNVPNDSDDFGDFAQSTTPSTAIGEDFGDFAQSSAFDDGDDDDFGDFSAPVPSTDSGADAFGDFSSPPVSVATSSSDTAAVSSFASDKDLAVFFRDAFADVSVSVTIAASTRDVDDKFTSSYVVDSVSTPTTAGFVTEIVNAAVEKYVATAVDQKSKSLGDGDSHSNKLLDGTYIKYVLTEKIQEASQQNGIFPHGSDAHQSYLAIVAGGQPAEMRAALQRLQDELFHKSVNDAMMRIAHQAALSAKAKIAEQAAQQQASAKGSSLLATTRQLLLSRNSGPSGSNASGGHDKDRSAAAGGGSLGVLTPTGASVHKHSRFSFGHEDASTSSNASGSGDGKSDVPKRRHSGSSEADVVHSGSASTGATRTGSFGGTTSSGVPSGSSSSASGNGGLMKKFQDRFSSFSSSRHHSKTRVVSLRRMGQSGEDVRAMEINMDAISGGLDEVKWKCARFLYDVEEVSHVAPAQIRILSYPGNQVLSSKSDRSALVKFLKPGAVWTIDIGASNNDMMNEW